MTSTVVGYAFGLGLVGVLNPCGFPLLPAYLSLFATGDSPDWRMRLLRGLRAGMCVTAGFLAVFAVLGVAAASVLSAILGWIPWLMLLVGAALMVFGAAALTGRATSLRVPYFGFRAGRGAIAMVGFGVSYALGSLSCSLPLFLVGVLGVFARSSFVGGISAFIAYAIGVALFVTAASLAASFAGRLDLRRLRPLSAALPRIAGGVLLLAGAYLVYYWQHELRDPTQRSATIAGVQDVQSAISGWVSVAALPLGIGLGAIVVGALVALAIAASHASREENSRADV